MFLEEETGVMRWPCRLLFQASDLVHTAFADLDPGAFSKHLPQSLPHAVTHWLPEGI